MAWTTPGTAVAGDVLTAAFWNEQVRDNQAYLKTEVDDITASIKRLAFIERTTNYTINQTSISAASDVFSSDLTWTADGSTYIVEFFGLVGTVANQFTKVFMTDGGNNGRGALAVIYFGNETGVQAVYARKYYTPSAGSVTINVRATVPSGSTSINAGDGTGTNDPPAYLAVYGPVTT